MVRRDSLFIAASLLALAAPAGAQEPVEEPPPPAPTPAPPPPHPAPMPKRGGAMKLTTSTGIRDRGRVYVGRKQRVTLHGSAGSGAAVAVSISGRKGGVVLHPAVKAGAFKVVFKARRLGRYSIRATQAAGPGAKVVSVQAVAPRAGGGDGGWKVRVLKKGLRARGFAVSGNSRFDGATARAVIAFRKTNAMKRTGFASAKVFAKLLRHQGAFRLRYPKAGKHVEFDWSKQVLTLADKGRPVDTYHASSGKPSTPTVFGTFHFYSKTLGTNAKGMVDSNYFIRGYAIHGFREVPTYAASHGCIRVPIPNAASIYSQISLGEPIFVYR